MKVYLAGPDVFLPNAVLIGQRKREICAQYGLTGLYPLDNAIPPDSPSVSCAIFKANTALMEEADAIIANLTPFRGPSADPGTVYELGFMAGRGKLCAGYSNDADEYHAKLPDLRRHPDGGDHYVDEAGHMVENFGHPDNLMIVHALDEYGLQLVTGDVPDLERWSDLAGFEACVRWLAERRA